MRRPMILAAMLVALAMSFTGCGKDHPTVTTPLGSCCAPSSGCRITTQANCTGTWIQGGSCYGGPCYLRQTSPANVLENLAGAYENRNIDEYKKLFADDFVFVFSTGAYDPDNPTPAQWGKVDEFTSAEHMFASELVNRITLDFVMGVPERADSVTYGAQAWKVRVESVNLQVSGRNEVGGLLIYLVPGTTEVFYFREEPSRPASDGHPTWFIFRWEDQPIGEVKTEEKTWGEVKCIFR